MPPLECQMCIASFSPKKKIDRPQAAVHQFLVGAGGSVLLDANGGRINVSFNRNIANSLVLKDCPGVH